MNNLDTFENFVIKVERTLIVIMIDELIKNKLLDNQKEFGLEIIDKIINEVHRKNFVND